METAPTKSDVTMGMYGGRTSATGMHKVTSCGPVITSPSKSTI